MNIDSTEHRLRQNVCAEQRRRLESFAVEGIYATLSFQLKNNYQTTFATEPCVSGFNAKRGFMVRSEMSIPSRLAIAYLRGAGKSNL